MKNLLLLVLLNVAFAASSWAQLNQINGTTKTKTKVTFGPDARTARIPAGHAVDIIDANNYFFTIKYNDGNGYVNRTHIEYDPAELNQLMKIKNGVGDVLDFPGVNSKVDEPYKYEIDHIRYCALKYRNEIMAGYAISFAGAAAITSPFYIEMNNPDIENIVKKAGYGMGVLGALLIIDSNKWMKRMYFGPEGFGIRYNF
ncbi:MAG TPA: hypothetical protein VGK10_04305 [Prolixibacteraceae bacterium]|jgi:hypothetical protein